LPGMVPVIISSHRAPDGGSPEGSLSLNTDGDELSDVCSLLAEKGPLYDKYWKPNVTSAGDHNSECMDRLSTRYVGEQSPRAPHGSAKADMSLSSMSTGLAAHDGQELRTFTTVDQDHASSPPAHSAGSTPVFSKLLNVPNKEHRICGAESGLERSATASSAVRPGFRRSDTTMCVIGDQSSSFNSSHRLEQPRDRKSVSGHCITNSSCLEDQEQDDEAESVTSSSSQTLMQLAKQVCPDSNNVALIHCGINTDKDDMLLIVEDSASDESCSSSSAPYLSSVYLGMTYPR